MTAKSNGVIRKQLPNGLTVLLREDHSNPVVAINMWFRVGSVSETDAENGLAHFQEHMVFKGTERHGVGEIANIVKTAGGNLNAATSYSYTMYYVVMPARAFSLGLDVQADAMMNSTFDPAEFNKERKVVIDEARMYDDTPDSFAFYRTMELGFQVHNYRRPIAGYENVVEKFTRDQLVEFYTRYYRPNHAILAVVGDVTPDAAMAEIERVYGGWETGTGDVNESPAEPAQSQFRFKAMNGAIDHAYFSYGFHVPSCLHGDYPALEMLTTLLGSGRSSRLYRRVVEGQRLATTVSVDLLAEKWPGYFMIFGSAPTSKWAAARDAVCDELARFQNEPVQNEELEKARRQVEKSMYGELETVEGQASSLGYYEVLGDYRLADAHREAIRAVTPEDLTRVARTYFHVDNCSAISYLPEGDHVAVPTREDTEAAIRQRLRQFADEGATATGSIDVSAGATPVVRTVGEASATGVVRLATGNGVRVLVKQRATVPMVAMLTLFDGGTRGEPAGSSGLSNLTTRMLLKGTRSHDAHQVASGIEGLGGRIDAFSSFDASGVSVNILSEHLDAALDVYRDVLREPAFGADLVEKEKGRLLEELSKRNDHPFSHAMDHLFSALFEGHPYAHPFIGKEDELRVLTSDHCKAAYRAGLDPSAMTVAFVGDVEEDHALEIATRLLGDLEGGSCETLDRDVPVTAARPGVVELRRPNLRQAVGLVGFATPPMMTDESVALTVLNGILTGLGGRLFVELRDKRSLGYMAGSAYMPLYDRSIFFGYSNPHPDGLNEAVDVIFTELERVAREPVGREELRRSKEWLIGSQTMKLQRNMSQAVEYGTYETLGFGFEVVDRLAQRLQAVTPEAIQQAASSVFDRGNAVVVRLLPEDGVG